MRRPDCLLLLLAVVLAGEPARAGLRHLQVDDPLPELTLQDVRGNAVRVMNDRSTARLICYLPRRAESSQELLQEFKQITDTVPADLPPLSLVGIVRSTETAAALKQYSDQIELDMKLLADPNSGAWGRLGIIATPTTILVSADGKIRHIASGHGYNFVAALKSQVRRLAGRQSIPVDKDVDFLHNDTPQARMRRHLNMAKLLEKKGRIDAAIAEIEKARALLPDDREVRVELGQLLCKAGKGEQALKVMEDLQPESLIEESVVAFVIGWAWRQVGDLNKASEHLEKSISLNPRSARAWYELGRTREAVKDVDGALKAYRTALSLIFADPPDTLNTP